jgi:predicted Rossmann fold nucleotide-binding protein DprA/Smf involved in DNA uptake
MQQKPKSNVKALQALEAAFRAYAREEGRAPFELKTQPAADHDEAATLDLVQKTAEALKSAERRIEELETLREELVRMTRARMHRAQAAIYAAERRAGEAERLAKDAEEKAKTLRDCLTWVRESGRRAAGIGT